MTPGQRYRVITHDGRSNMKARESVMRFLDESETELIFDLRPLAGTQPIPKGDIQAIYEVAEGTKLMMPKIHRPGPTNETRIL